MPGFVVALPRYSGWKAAALRLEVDRILRSACYLRQRLVSTVIVRAVPYEDPALTTELRRQNPTMPLPATFPQFIGGLHKMQSHPIARNWQHFNAFGE